MSLSTIYSKTGKGAQVLTGKNKALPADSMRVLSLINGESDAKTILMGLDKLTEDEFAKILSRLLEGGHIRIVADETMGDFFTESGASTTIDVMEISAEEFIKTEASAHGLNSETQIRQHKEAEVRARLHAEEQLRLEAEAKAQIQSERDLLKITEMMVNSLDPDLGSTESPAASEKPAADAATVSEQKPSNAMEKVDVLPDKKVAPPEIPVKTQANTLEEERLAAEQAEAAAYAKQAQIAAQESEIKVRLKADKEARISAEREAAENARRDATAKAKREAEEKSRIAAELKAREEKQRLARKQAEAEEKSRQDAEKKARISAEREAAENARREAAVKAKREAEEKFRIAAELKAKEEKQRLARKQAEAETKARIKAEAKREAEKRAMIKAEEKAYKDAGQQPVMDIGKWMRSVMMLVRKLLITASVTTLVLLLLLQLVNLGMLVSPLAGPVEKMLSKNINEPVTIRKVYASLWPKPHLVLDEITIGGSSDINIETIRVLPVLSTVFDESISLQYIKVTGLTLNKDDIHRPLQWMASSASHGQLRFNQILLERASLVLPDMVLPPLDGELNFTSSGGFSSATINTGNGNAIIQIAPLNSALAIDLNAKEWALPFGTAIVFEELHATGQIENKHLELNQIKGRLYGGNIKGLMSIDWNTNWIAKGNFKLSEVELKEPMTELISVISLEGPVTSTGSFTAQAAEFSNLFKQPEILADFNIEDGSIQGIDLGKAMKAGDRNDIAGETRFNAFSGRMTAEKGNYKYRNLVLQAGQLQASGEIDIQDNQDISGTVHTSLMTPSRKLQLSFVLSGNTSNPALK